ncbi:MAG: hypothetical protein ABFD53_06235 [Anaerolineaceae bacterium]
MSGPLAPLVLWIQKGYGFKASAMHIGGAGLVLICGFLIGSWVDAYSSKKAGTYSSISSSFNRSRLKISAAMIAGVWGAVIGNSLPPISITFFLKDNYVSTVTVLAVIAGWLISSLSIKLLTHMFQAMHAPKSQIVFTCVVNVVTAIGLLHLGFLLSQDHAGFVFQKIAMGLVGAPAIVGAILTGIDGSR